jgi:hypothetical protein
MFTTFAHIEESGSNIDIVQNLLKDLKGKNVLVGIPEEEAERPNNDKINNAQLVYIHTHGIRRKAMREDMRPNLMAGMEYSKAYELYIHTNGSPLWHSPPRPIIEPAIEYHRDLIAQKIQEVISCALDGRDYKKALVGLGFTAQDIVREWFENPNNNWEPNAPYTIAKKGSDKPMIDTSELRKSIVFVIRDVIEGG